MRLENKYLKIIASLVSLTLLLGVISFILFRPTNKQEKQQQDAVSIKKEQAIRTITEKRAVSYTLTLTNTTAKPIAKAELWAYSPSNEGSKVQYTVSHPSSMQKDAAGNQLLYFVFENLPPFASKIINIEAELILQSSPKKQQLADPEIFLAEEPMVQTSNPNLRQLADKLRGEKGYETAENIFSWIIGNLEKSSYTAQERGALYALHKKKGDCTEFMHLALALARINGIPARGVSGYIVSKDSRLNGRPMHDWVEVYLDEAWQLLDPFYRVFMEKETDYLVMRYRKPTGTDDFYRWKTSSPHIQVTMGN
jgi:transglutaminase-like putative cysteine protease